MYKCYCDYCKKEINGSKITVEGQGVQIGKNTWFSKHLHPDCFNYMFSTDYKKVGGDVNTDN